MCFLDASKAFDRVTHSILFRKLVDRGVRGYIIRILIYWYSNQCMYVRWAGVLSHGFHVSNGVRQGGILSPYLFNVCEGFYNFSKVCLQFVSFLNVVFFRLFYDNITFQHLFIIIKCPAELNFDCKILIRSVPSTFVTELLLRGYVFLTFPKPTPSCMRSETNNNALSNLSYNGY